MATYTEIEFDSRAAAIIYRDREHEKRRPGRSVVFRNTMVPRVIIRDCEPGDPATYTIGSDSYACVVDDVTRVRLYYRLHGKLLVATMRADGRWRPRGSKCGAVITGEAIDYLDPSF